MRRNYNEAVEDGRVKSGYYASMRGDRHGAFLVQGPYGRNLRILASDGDGWEHVSVSMAADRRCPNWHEMCFVKKLFWEEDETVVQFHPKESEYVNCHPYCLAFVEAN